MGLRLSIALISGILMGLTTAPVGAWFLAWIAFAPLWFLVVENYSQKSLSLKDFFWLTPLGWSIGFYGVTLSWITGIHPLTWMGIPWLVSLAITFFCWSAITLVGVVLVIVWTVGMGIFCQLNNYFQVKFWQFDQNQKTVYLPLLRILIGTTLWCTLEIFWSQGNLWWTSLSLTQSPHNLTILHLGQISGPTTITAAIVAVNGLIAEGLINDTESLKNFAKPIKWKYFGIAFGLIISLHLTGLWLYQRPLGQAPETALKIGIIQGNIPNQILIYSDRWLRAIAGYTRGYQILATTGVDAVLTPETALPYQWTEENQRRSAFYQAILAQGVVAWLGAFGSFNDQLTNSLFTITSNGKIFSRYDKVKLVPLGEYIPFEEILGGIINKLSPLDAHLIPGKLDQSFDTPFGRAIVGICYDSAFSELFRLQAFRGGQFIITASNNTHFNAAMPAQHHAQDVMRAIETDRWAARATNTGYSGFIDPHGRTIWLSGINTYELHSETIYRRQTRTLYVSWGNWLLSLLLSGSAIGYFFYIVC